MSADTIEKNLTEQLKAQAQHIAGLEKELADSAKFIALGHLLGEVMHEVNNCNYIISNYAQLMRDQLDRNEAADRQVASDYLAAIETAVTDSSQLLRMLLKQSHTQEDVAFEKINLYQLLKTLANELQPILPKSIELACLAQEADEPTLFISAKPVLLRQVLINLILNASDACDESGRIELSCEFLQLSQSKKMLSGTALQAGDYAYLVVQDNGQGMAAETLKHIFSAYFTTKPDDRGTGLGLKMVNKCIKELQGGINCRSQLHFGTIFELYLPLLNV